VSIPVVGLGAGGHAKVVIEILKLNGQYELIGFLDPKEELQGRSVLGVPALGSDEQLSVLRRRGIHHFFVGLGSSSDTQPRRRLYECALTQGMKPVTAIHPSAVISPSAALGVGATVMASAVINTGAQLGDNVIVNTGAIVEHDCIIGNHVHIATGATLSGGVLVGDGTHVGVGAVVRQGIRIGVGVVIGAGAVVVKDVDDSQVVIGNPARPRERC